MIAVGTCIVYIAYLSSVSLRPLKQMNLSIDPKAVSASGFFGACVGVATKRLTQDAMYGVGLGVMGLQLLNYLGYITIEWNKIGDDITKRIDQDGDGQLSRKDFQIILNRFVEIMKTGMPDAAGFSIGFVVGLKLM